MEITVVISTFNGAKYIIEQLDSLRSQILKPNEVLIFDDRSTDDTVGIIERYILDANLSNWSLICNKENKGWKRNFIESLSDINGDIIFFCDQDDIWMPEKILEMTYIMETRPEIDVLTSNYEVFCNDGHVVRKSKPGNGEIIKQPICNRIFDTKYPGCTYCIRKEIARKAIKYWQPDFPHDALVWRMAMFKETLYSYNKSLVRWRRHSESSYTIESIKAKTQESKREWIEYGKRFITMLQQYLLDEQCSTPEKEDVLYGSLEWLKCRAEFYDTHSIVIGLNLFKYRNYYPKIKQYFGDWYLIYFKQ